MKSAYEKVICILMFIAVQFTLDKIWNQSSHPLTADDWVKKIWSLLIKWNINIAIKTYQTEKHYPRWNMPDNSKTNITCVFLFMEVNKEFKNYVIVIWFNKQWKIVIRWIIPCKYQYTLISPDRKNNWGIMNTLQVLMFWS